MSRIIESWWWHLIAVAVLVYWGAFFPSGPQEEPRMFVATHVALAISMIMCVIAGVAWFIRLRTRAR